MTVEVRPIGEAEREWLAAVTEAGKSLKPSIPERGASGIPIKNELELELLLDHQAGR
jgi:hypothetical protein